MAVLFADFSNECYVLSLQFLDHDIGLTEGAAGFGYANISLPPGDMMAANGCPHIEFTRSHFVNVSGSREPVNEITCKLFVGCNSSLVVQF